MNKKGFAIILISLSVFIITIVLLSENSLSERTIDYSQPIIDTKIKITNYELLLNQSINDCNWEKTNEEIINCIQQKSNTIITQIFSNTLTNCNTNNFSVYDSNIITTKLYCQTNIMSDEQFLIDLTKNIFLNGTIEPSGEPPSPPEPPPELNEPDDPSTTHCFNELSNPIQICSLTDLTRIREILDGNYILMNDIDASNTINWNYGNGWRPIGTSTNPFTGTLNGNNKTIENLHINRTNEDNLGLIGYTSNSEIKNIRLINVNITGKTSVGGLIGYNNGSVKNCYSTGNVKGYYHVGGLIGYNINSVANCYSTVNIIGTGNNIGGLIGNNYNSSVENCYSTGKVTGKYQVGGLIGYKYEGSIEKCYWDINTSGQITSAGGNGKTTNEMKNIITYNNWNIEMTNKNLNEGYPYLSWETGEEGTWKIYSDLYHIPIYTLSDLDKIRDNLDKKYILMNDIDATETTKWNSGKGWEQIGTLANPFTGILDGNNKTIKNLYINRTNINNMGLIGYTNNAEIKNIGLINVNIIGPINVGALIGYNQNSSITNCYSTGNVTAQYMTAGGLIGTNNGTIQNCYSTANTKGTTEVGGLIGNNDGSVNNCYSTGNTASKNNFSYVGGLIGRNNSGSITNCYSTGDVNGNTFSGGLIGRNSSGSITNCYSTGSVIGINLFGGLIGFNEKGAINNCYWDINTSGQTTSSGGEGKTTNEMKYMPTFNNWDIDASHTNLNNGYPYLSLETGEEGTWKIYFDLYQKPIYNVTTLNKIRNKLDENYILMNDIDATETITWNNGLGWEPIGTTTNPFTGILDGNNKTIKNLYIKRDNESYVGLIGYTNNAEIKNIGIINVNIIGKSRVGALIGDNPNSLVESCYSTGTIKGYNAVGGLIGGNHSDSIIKNCYSTVNTKSTNQLSYVGGLIGLNFALVQNCYSTGTVNGNDFSGGLIGENRGSVENCYSTGTVISNRPVGGLIGNNAGDINNCYWDVNSSGQEKCYAWEPYNQECYGKNVNGLEPDAFFPKSVLEEDYNVPMKNNTNSTNDWDFDSIWQKVEGHYPRLKWQDN